MVNKDEYTIAHCAQLHVLKCDLPFECERRWMWSGCELETVTEFPLFYITDRQNTAISTWLSSQTSYKLQHTAMSISRVIMQMSPGSLSDVLTGCCRVTWPLQWGDDEDYVNIKELGLPAPPSQMFIRHALTERHSQSGSVCPQLWR